LISKLLLTTLRRRLSHGEVDTSVSSRIPFACDMAGYHWLCCL
jgi:hypothetical protein